jgi:hypothetical protein
MLEYLGDKISDRKRRLFACACCRRVWPLITADYRLAVETAEKFADGLVGEDERSAADFLVEGEDIEDAVTPAEVAASWAVVSADCEELDPATEDYALLTATNAARAARNPSRERASQASLVHDLFGNPFRPASVNPAWTTRNVTALAETIYTDRTFDRMPILADALEDAGCANQDILAHCRGGGEHVLGCWVVDLLLGKE